MGIGLQPYRRQTMPPSRRGYPPAGALPRGVLHDGEDAVFEHMVHDMCTQAAPWLPQDRVDLLHLLPFTPGRLHPAPGG